METCNFIRFSRIYVVICERTHFGWFCINRDTVSTYYVLQAFKTYLVLFLFIQKKKKLSTLFNQVGLATLTLYSALIHSHTHARDHTAIKVLSLPSEFRILILSGFYSHSFCACACVFVFVQNANIIWNRSSVCGFVIKAKCDTYGYIADGFSVLSLSLSWITLLHWNVTCAIVHKIHWILS